MRARPFVAAVAAAVSAGASMIRPAAGAVSITGQTRSVSSSAVSTPDGTFGSPGGSDTHNDSNPAAGAYDKTVRSTVNIVEPTNLGAGFPQTVTYSAGATASQTSSVATADLSATGSSVASAQHGGAQGSTTGTADSAYATTFTVDQPTPFTLAGSLTGSANYHTGSLEVLTDYVTLSGSTAGVLYSVSDANKAGQSMVSYAFNDPVSFATVLQPGQTYTLSAEAYAQSPRSQVGGYFVSPGQDAFQFQAIVGVPEPTSAAALALVTAGAVLGRRRRGHAASR